MAESSPTHPILLLKNPSPSPSTDTYTTALSPPASAFTPHYIPILTHTLLPDALIQLLLTHLSPKSPASSAPFPFGALILTSQRAVAALSTALTSPPIQNLPQGKLQSLRIRIYTVGPATAKATEGVVGRWLPHCKIYGGAKAGSGEVLARLILEEGEEGYNDDFEVAYNEELHSSGEELWGGGKKPVLFLTGQTRRDIIPKMLQDPPVAEEEKVRKRIKVEEIVVYQSSELEEFAFTFEQALSRTEPAIERGVRWVVVFSPMGGRAVLKGLGWLDKGTGRVRKELLRGRRTFVACIGPTTRGYLWEEFEFEADVVAGSPSAEGLRDAIAGFMREKWYFQPRDESEGWGSVVRENVGEGEGDREK